MQTSKRETITGEYLLKYPEYNRRKSLQTPIHPNMEVNSPSAPQPMTDRILVRWERDFDIVIPTLVSSE